MLKKRVKDSGIKRGKKLERRILLQVVGSILCVFLNLPVEAGEVPKKFSTDSGTGVGLVQRIQSKSDLGKRRDPFRPINKGRAISSSPKKAQLQRPTIIPIPVISYPNWKLLGIIDGQYGRQAVIQVSPQERVFIRPGLEVGRSGWIIKTISKGEVLVEHPFPSTSEKGLSETKAFILSFGTLGQPS